LKEVDAAGEGGGRQRHTSFAVCEADAKRHPVCFMAFSFLGLQGDHLISQCTYNSESRSTITLGGLSTREETCLAYLLYWPRVDLSLCYSLPSLGTILHSLGIEELYP